MTNSYLNLKQKHKNAISDFPIVFAFSNKQFEEAMAELGLSPADTDKIFSIGGGGFIRKTDSEAFGEMLKRHSNEMEEAVNNDSTGDGFIFDMFVYELANHEYNYTGEIDDTLDALGLTFEEIKAKPNLQYGLDKARKKLSKCML